MNPLPIHFQVRDRLGEAFAEERADHRRREMARALAHEIIKLGRGVVREREERQEEPPGSGYGWLVTTYTAHLLSNDREASHLAAIMYEERERVWSEAAAVAHEQARALFKSGQYSESVGAHRCASAFEAKAREAVPKVMWRPMTSPQLDMHARGLEFLFEDGSIHDRPVWVKPRNEPVEPRFEAPTGPQTMGVDEMRAIGWRRLGLSRDKLTPCPS